MSAQPIKPPSCSTKSMELFMGKISCRLYWTILRVTIYLFLLMLTLNRLKHFQLSLHLPELLFTEFGLPETVASDNNSCFVSEEFQKFSKSNGVKQINSAPYHPSSNGLAERVVQIVRKGLRRPQMA